MTTKVTNKIILDNNITENIFFSLEDEGDNEIPVATHARRASVTVASRFSQSQSPNTIGPFPDTQRGTNLLNLGRRLSLSSATFVKVTTFFLRN